MDRDVLAQLYERYYQPALFYLLALCRDRHLAEDLVQEAFVRAYLSLPEDVPSFPYWLMRVCRNLLCDHRRKRRRHADGDPPERPTVRRRRRSDCCSARSWIALYRAIGAPFGGRAGAFEPVLLRAAAAQ